MPGTRSSDGGRGPRPGAGRWFLWLLVVGNAVLGLVATAAAVVNLLMSPEDRLWSVGTSLVVVAVGAGWIAAFAVGTHRNYLYVPPTTGRRIVVTEVDGGRAVVLPWRTTFLRGPFLSALFAAVVFGGAGVMLLTQGNPGWWILALVAVPVLIFLPDKLLQLSRECRVVMSPQGIGVTGWDGDAWLDWDDVQGIAFDQVNQWTVLRVVGRDGAASWRYRRRSRVLHAAAPKGPWVDIPGPALEIEATALVEAITHYTRYPSARPELAGEAGRRRLVGTS